MEFQPAMTSSPTRRFLAFVAFALSISLSAHGQVAHYMFAGNLVSSDSHATSTASDLTVGNPNFIYYTANGSSNICLDGTWSLTTEQTPAGGSNNYFETVITPDAGQALDLDSIEIRTWGGDTNYSVTRMGVYADEDAGPGGDNFTTKIGGFSSIFPEQTRTVDLSSVPWLQGRSGPVALRVYFWASSYSSNHAEINWVKVYGSTHSNMGTIGNKVWKDLNCDGVRQSTTEPGLGGVTVNLMNANNPGVVIATTTTSSTGSYSFNVPAGSYIVQVVPPLGYVWTTQYAGSSTSSDSNGNPLTNASDAVLIAVGQNDTSVDFGFCLCQGVQALATDLGPACNLPLDPVFSATPPILGGVSTLSMTSQFPNALGFLFASLPPVQPLHLSYINCNIYVDVLNQNNFFLITNFFSDGNGSWNLPIPIPAMAQFLGFELIFQIRLCAPGQAQGPLDPDWLSNGLRFRVGCP